MQLALKCQPAPDVVIAVISEGLQDESILEASKRTRLRLDNLVLFNFQPFEALPDVVASGDVLIAIIEKEAGAFSVPSKILTYLCAGRPLLLAVPASNLAARTVSDNQAGLVVDPSDMAGFLAAAMTLITDQETAAKMGRMGRNYALRAFDIRQIASRFESVLRAAVRSPREPFPVGEARNMNLIFSLFIALSLLPYVQIIPTGSDTQPNAFILAALILAASIGAVRLNRVQALPWLLPPIALVIFFVEVVGAGTDLFQNLRSLYNYISLPVISTVVVLNYRSIRKRILPVLNGVNLIYFVVGLAQVVTGSQLVGNLVGGGDRVDTYSFLYRGAVGLAPEPTYYGTVMFLFILLYAILGKERSKWTALALVQILFFSRSTMVILYIGILVVIRALFARRFKTIAVGGGACAAILLAAVMNLNYFCSEQSPLHCRDGSAEPHRGSRS